MAGGLGGLVPMFMPLRWARAAGGKKSAAGSSFYYFHCLLAHNPGGYKVHSEIIRLSRYPALQEDGDPVFYFCCVHWRKFFSPS